jgi:hypothetical protein
LLLALLHQTPLSAEGPAPGPDRLVVACPEQGRCGIMGLSGKFLVKPSYMHISGSFVDGLAAARSEDGLWGMIGIDGRWAVEPEFLDMRGMSEGLSAAMGNEALWGYIDHAGNWAIAPKYASAGDFFGGAAPVELGGGYGLIDRKGQWIKPPDFTRISWFIGGMAMAAVKGGKDGQERVGFLNPKGGWAIPPDFAEAKPFHLSDYTTATKYDPSSPDGRGESGWIDRSGRFFPKDPEGSIPHARLHEDTVYDKSLAPAVDPKTMLAGFKDQSGAWAVRPEYEFVDMFQQNGVARVVKDGKNGLIDKRGAWIARPQELDFGDFVDGLSVATAPDDKQGLIDSSGKWLLQPEYHILEVITHSTSQAAGQ